jgi:hypothetical protein
MTCPTPKKRKFGDLEAAEAYRTKIWKTGTRSTPTEVYRCKCGLFHIASSNAPRSKRRREREGR